MHTLTVLFPVLISNQSSSGFALALLFQVNKLFFLHFPLFFSLSLSSTCSSSFFFYLLFHSICFIKHSLSTSYVLETVLGYKDSRTGKAQTVPEKREGEKQAERGKGRRSNDDIEGRYVHTRGWPAYRGEEWIDGDERESRCEGSGGWERDV